MTLTTPTHGLDIERTVEVENDMFCSRFLGFI